MKKCPACRMDGPAEATRCWLCGESLADVPRMSDALPVLELAPPETGPNTFKLSTLMLVVTLLCVSLGLGMAIPGLGFVLALLVTPALVRTMAMASKRKAAGDRLTGGQKVLAFLGSLGMVFAVGLAAQTAFVIVCTGGFFAGAAVSGSGSQNESPLIFGLVAGVFGGAVVAIFLFVWMLRRTWPKK